MSRQERIEEALQKVAKSANVYANSWDTPYEAEAGRLADRAVKELEDARASSDYRSSSSSSSDGDSAGYAYLMIFLILTTIVIVTNWDIVNKWSRSVTVKNYDTINSVPTIVPPDNASVGSSWFQAKDGMTMVYVPAGEFEMGSRVATSLVECRKFRNDCDDVYRFPTDLAPIHTVYLDDYWIDQTEVTNAMYAKCVSATACDSLDNSWRGDNAPVSYVSWEDANKYCSWVGRRLPTEAEWEKAARGGLTGQTYPWGDIEPTREYGSQNGASFKSDRPKNVASYNPNGYGVYDMAGNVNEWVSDWYDEIYYENSPLSNPLGADAPLNPDKGDVRLTRGGSWRSSPYRLQVSLRFTYVMGVGFPLDDIGFRCVRSYP